MKKFQAVASADFGGFGNGDFDVGLHDSAEEAQAALDKFWEDNIQPFCYYGEKVYEVEVAE